MHHGHHAAHLVWSSGPAGSTEQLDAVRAVFGEWHTVLIDVLGAVVAVVYLGLRRHYRALVHTPGMFDDAVRRAAEQQLRDLAFTDALTGVPNRAAYQAFADELSGREVDVCVLFLDLDGFKAVNDALGHEAGDRVLRDVGQRLTSTLREGERVFRLGGDELVVVGVGHGPAAGQELVRRATRAAALPVALREGSMTVGASVGLACGRAAVGVDALLREADQAMYAIKKARAVLDLPAPRTARPRPVAG
jgi:diguanylate cyclase (GGDEF)-like protein